MSRWKTIVSALAPRSARPTSGAADGAGNVGGAHCTSWSHCCWPSRDVCRSGPTKAQGPPVVGNPVKSGLINEAAKVYLLRENHISVP